MESHPDPDYDPSDETEYECLDCGHTLSARTQPGDCPECDGSLRNRAFPLE